MYLSYISYIHKTVTNQTHHGKPKQGIINQNRANQNIFTYTHNTFTNHIYYEEPVQCIMNQTRQNETNLYIIKTRMSHHQPQTRHYIAM